MFVDIITLCFYLTCNILSILASELCFIEEKSKVIEENNSNEPSNYRVVYCKTKYEECCEQGCCPLKAPPEVLQMGVNGRFSPFIWFLVTLIVIGYIYFGIRYCCKKLCKNRNDFNNSSPVTISRGNTQPQELNLMLSFNPNRDGLENFNFDNLGNTHIHVPFMPLTPVTPPPAYVTLTPPPTYNVAIHFPQLQPKQKMEVLEEEVEPQAKS